MVTAAVLAACSGPSGPLATLQRSEVTTPDGLASGDVVAIADGDTFDLATEVGEVTVRLLGVNAPERDECFHDEAARGLELALESGNVTLEPHGLDQFGRTLAYTFAGDTFVNLTLVESGLAIATTPDEGENRGTALLAAEEAAHNDGIGLWSSTACGGAPPNADLSIDASGVNPPGDDADVLDLERVTILNNGELETNLSDWVLRDESSAHRFRFPDGSTIGPGSGLDIASDDPAWEPGESPVWNNGGDMVLLLTPGGAIVARHRFGP